MSLAKALAIDEICQRGSIRDCDVATLRRTFCRDPHLGIEDIDALFRLQTLARVQDPSWSDFFIETLTDYVVRELEPTGYVTAQHAGWLLARVSTGGRVRSKIEHDLVLNVIEKARWVPESLLVFALGQIRDAVVSGQGALRAGGVLVPGVVTLPEIDRIRKLLFAYGKDSGVPITQAEVELMLDIDRALGADAEHVFPAELAAWGDLIEKVVACAVLRASGYVAGSREEALREGAPMWWREPRGSERSLSLIVGGAVIGCYRRQSSEERALSALERQRIEIITGERVVEVEPARLAMRLREHGTGPRIGAVIEALGRSGLMLEPVFGAIWRAAAA